MCIVKHKFLRCGIIILMVKVYENMMSEWDILTKAPNIKNLRKSDKKTLYFLEFHSEK